MIFVKLGSRLKKVVFDLASMGNLIKRHNRDVKYRIRWIMDDDTYRSYVVSVVDNPPLEYITIFSDISCVCGRFRRREWRLNRPQDILTKRHNYDTLRLGHYIPTC